MIRSKKLWEFLIDKDLRKSQLTQMALLYY